MGLIRGKVVNDGNPVQGAKVYSLDIENNTIAEPSITDSNGMYEVKTSSNLQSVYVEYEEYSGLSNNITENTITDFQLGILQNIEVKEYPVIESQEINCLEMDANWVDLGNSLYLSNNHPFTAEGWVKFNAFDSRDMMFCRNNAVRNTSPYTWLLGVIDSGVNMGAYDGSDWQNISYNFNTDEWYHIAFAYDGSTMHYVINGNEEGTNSYTFSDDSGYNAQIGGYGDSSHDVVGYKSDFRFWDVYRTPQEIKDNMYKRLTGSETGLIGYWEMDEGSGDVIYDSTNNGIDGSLQGPTWTTQYRDVEDRIEEGFSLIDNNIKGSRISPAIDISQYTELDYIKVDVGNEDYSSIDLWYSFNNVDWFELNDNKVVYYSDNYDSAESELYIKQEINPGDSQHSIIYNVSTDIKENVDGYHSYNHIDMLPASLGEIEFEEDSLLAAHNLDDGNSTITTRYGDVLVEKETYSGMEVSGEFLLGNSTKDERTLKDKITKYDKVSLHPDLNRDYDLIKELGPENLIILVNEECVEKCPYRKNHYDMISSKILYDKEISKEEDYYDKIDKFHKQMSRGDLKLTFKEINKLYNIGVRDYKLQGRERIYREYLQYLTKYIEKEMIQTFIKKNI
jgi:hypothetical protein